MEVAIPITLATAVMVTVVTTAAATMEVVVVAMVIESLPWSGVGL